MTDRRSFLKSAGAASLMAGPWLKSNSRAASPNDTVNVAVIGIRSRGAAHYKQFAKLPNVNVVTLCDVDERLFAKALKDLGGEQRIKTETDLRRVLDDKSVDAVSIATPDHWHALATIWACQAGKDVYVEKPASHTIWEGRRMVEAARKYNRIVAVGLQSRSNPAIQAAIKFLHEGGIGELHTARGLCFKPRDTIGKKASSLDEKGPPIAGTLGYVDPVCLATTAPPNAASESASRPPARIPDWYGSKAESAAPPTRCGQACS